MDPENSNVNVDTNSKVPLNPPKNIPEQLLSSPNPEIGSTTSQRVFKGSKLLQRFQQDQLTKKHAEHISNTKVSDSQSTPTSPQDESKTQNLEEGGPTPEEHSKISSNSSTPTPTQEQSQVRVKFKKKLIPEAYILKMLETFDDDGIVGGNSFRMVANDLLNLRRLCEAIHLAYKNEDYMDMNQLVSMLGLIL
jgi:hypothetical protein